MAYTVVVTENGLGRYQQEILVEERHHLLADEPPEVGGDGAGPAPTDFLMAGLGACTSMTIRMYAERKEWPLKAIRVALRHDRVETDGQKLDRFERLITLEGDLSPEQRERLLDIANKCPVHRLLQQPVRVDTRLAD